MGLSQVDKDTTSSEQKSTPPMVSVVDSEWNSNVGLAMTEKIAPNKSNILPPIGIGSRSGSSTGMTSGIKHNNYAKVHVADEG